jgi:UV DNA damage endonuclease
MIFRLGYVAMTLNLEDCSPSGTVTLTSFNKLPDEEARLYRLKKVARKNLENTLRILRYNKALNIDVYRLTSKLIPLATHPSTEGWDYIGDFEGILKEIGDFIRENDFRISAHPDHYTLINSENEKVLEDSIKDLNYHVKIYEAMGLDFKYKLVIHLGGVYKNKEESIRRFKTNFLKLPERISRRITLENDDKSYTANDILKVCRELGIPMVLDIHHHNCVNEGVHLETIINEVFKTWEGEYFNPKIHFSSPKSCKDFRSHADFIELKEFADFLEIVKSTKMDFDAMLESKSKDSALIKLSKELSELDKVRRINTGTFEII